ncbi:MAG: CPBP family intramembrane metalloprotease [Bacteroidetes bacterium QS_8_68_28]|nr:MAG: CPBP family intramembrane metalloprotease [Bacteroidetes bacterium QS_8_68_28]
MLDPPSKPNWWAYHRATRSATYGFLAALPLVGVYEVLIAVVNLSRPFAPSVRVGAEAWLKMFVPAPLGLGLVVLVTVLAGLGGAIFYLERNRRIPLRARYFALLVGESALYAFAVAAFVSSVVAVLFAGVASVEAQAGPRPGGMLARLALSIGAGVYEELFFRVILVGGLAWGLRRVLARKRYAYGLAALLGAFLFSAAHYTGLYGDALAAPSFAFRFLFGLALNGLFLARGFAVAAWTHALYDVMVVTGVLG